MANDAPASRRRLTDGIVFIAVAILCLFEGYRLHVTANPRILAAGIGPGVYVLLLGTILLVTGVVHLVGQLRSEGEDVASQPTSIETKIKLAIVVVCLAGYVILTNLIGYLAASLLFYLATFRVFGVRNWLLNAGLSIAFGGGSYLLFVHYLGIIFPEPALLGS